jgi:hypothetical protein
MPTERFCDIFIRAFFRVKIGPSERDQGRIRLAHNKEALSGLRDTLQQRVRRCLIGHFFPLDAKLSSLYLCIIAAYNQNTQRRFRNHEFIRTYPHLLPCQRSDELP